MYKPHTELLAFKDCTVRVTESIVLSSLTTVSSAPLNRFGMIFSSQSDALSSNLRRFLTVIVFSQDEACKTSGVCILGGVNELRLQGAAALAAVDIAKLLSTMHVFK